MVPPMKIVLQSKISANHVPTVPVHVDVHLTTLAIIQELTCLLKVHITVCLEVVRVDRFSLHLSDITY